MSVLRISSRSGSVAGSRNGLTGEVLGRDVVPFRQRLDVRDKSPDLIVGDSAAPRRHAVRATLVNRLIDGARGAAEMPAAVLEARAHRPGTVGAVAVETVVRDEQLGPFGDALRIPFVRIRQGREAPTVEREPRLNVVRMLDEIRRLRALLWRPLLSFLNPVCICDYFKLSNHTPASTMINSLFFDP